MCTLNNCGCTIKTKNEKQSFPNLVLREGHCLGILIDASGKEIEKDVRVGLTVGEMSSSIEHISV